MRTTVVLPFVVALLLATLAGVAAVEYTILPFNESDVVQDPNNFSGTGKPYNPNYNYGPSGAVAMPAPAVSPSPSITRAQSDERNEETPSASEQNSQIESITTPQPVVNEIPVPHSAPEPLVIAQEAEESADDSAVSAQNLEKAFPAEEEPTEYVEAPDFSASSDPTLEALEAGGAEVRQMASTLGVSLPSLEEEQNAALYAKFEQFLTAHDAEFSAAFGTRDPTEEEMRDLFTRFSEETYPKEPPQQEGILTTVVRFFTGLFG